MIVRRYSSDDIQEWNACLKVSRNGLFMFNRYYMDYHRDRFEDHSLMFYDEDSLIGIMPCSMHDGTLKSHGGLTYGGIISGTDMRQALMIKCMEALKKYCIDSRINEIIYKAVPAIYHIQPAEDDVFALRFCGGELEKVEASTVINLANPIPMSKLRKRQIRKAKKEFVEIAVENNKDAYLEFMELQTQVLLEHHGISAVHTGEEMFLLHSRFPNHIHLYTARMNGELIAGSIVFEYEDAIHTQYLCANKQAREIGALDATIEKIKENYGTSKRWLDFGISTENNGYFLNEGLINQKEGFGGRTATYYTWSLKITNT